MSFKTVLNTVLKTVLGKTNSSVKPTLAVSITGLNREQAWINTERTSKPLLSLPLNRSRIIREKSKHVPIEEELVNLCYD